MPNLLIDNPTLFGGQGQFIDWAPQRLKELFPSFSSNLIVNDHIVYENHPYFQEELKESKVLIVGGGPSSLTLTLDITDEYDQVWSMNHCYKNKLLNQECPPEVVMLGAEVNLRDPDLISFLQKWSPLIGLEIHPNWQSQIKYINQEFHNHPHWNAKPLFCFISRLYNQLGVGVRMVNLAAALGAVEVHFIGFDGPVSQHAWNKNTKLPSLVTPANAQTVFQQQYDQSWLFLKALYPKTKFVSLQKNNSLHRQLLGTTE